MKTINLDRIIILLEKKSPETLKLSEMIFNNFLTIFDKSKYPDVIFVENLANLAKKVIMSNDDHIRWQNNDKNAHGLNKAQEAF